VSVYLGMLKVINAGLLASNVLNDSTSWRQWRRVLCWFMRNPRRLSGRFLSKNRQVVSDGYRVAGRNEGPRDISRRLKAGSIVLYVQDMARYLSRST
jgi:hypothetical protein